MRVGRTSWRGYAGVEVVEGDLRDFDDVTRAVQGVDAIYHLAAAFGGPFDNRQYLNINGMGTLNILEAVRSDLPDLKRLVYACTEAIYWRLGEKGRFFEEPITEEMVSRVQANAVFPDEVGGGGAVHGRITASTAFRRHRCGLRR